MLDPDCSTVGDGDGAGLGADKDRFFIGPNLQLVAAAETL